MLSDPHSYLGRRLQTVLQVFARWIISKEGKARQLRLPHTNPLVQCIEELFHCGGAIETYHLHVKNKGHISFSFLRSTGNQTQPISFGGRAAVSVVLDRPAVPIQTVPPISKIISKNRLELQMHCMVQL